MKSWTKLNWISPAAAIVVGLFPIHAALSQVGPAPGGEAWSAAGTLVFDESGHVYRTVTSPAPSISRVAPGSGSEMWSHPGSTSYFYVAQGCAYPDRVVLRSGRTIVALSADSGTELWSTDLAGALAQLNVSSSIICKSDRAEVYVLHGATTRSLSAIRRATGQVLWTLPVASSVNVVAETSDVVVIDENAGAGTVLRGLDTQTGAELWRYSEGTWLATFASPVGELYINGDHELQQLDIRSGAVRWRATTRSEYPWVTFEHGLTFLRDGDRLASLDPASGREVWAFTLAPAANVVPISTVLSSGDVAVVRQTAGSGVTELTMLDGRQGTQRWTRRLAQPFANIEEDECGRIYARTDDTLTRLDLGDGHDLWSHEVPRAAGPEHFQGGLERVASSDDASVFVLYRGPGYRYPPMGLLALDAETGALRWQYDDAGSVQVVGADRAHLFVQTGYFQTMTKALVK